MLCMGNQRSKSRQTPRPSDNTPDWIEQREIDVTALISRTRGVVWSARLMSLLLDELFVADELHQRFGSVGHLPTRRYPQVVAAAILLRHSWRHDTLAAAARRLGLNGRPMTKQRGARRSHT